MADIKPPALPKAPASNVGGVDKASNANNSSENSLKENGEDQDLPKKKYKAGANSDGGEEDAESEESGSDKDLSSPEAILMMGLAVFFDICGYLDFIPVIGTVIEIIADTIATIIFFIWMLITGRKGWLKFLISAIIEFIPYLDDFTIIINIFTTILGVSFPMSWIGFVYSVL
jgi:hypothetical protein